MAWKRNWKGFYTVRKGKAWREYTKQRRGVSCLSKHKESDEFTIIVDLDLPEKSITRDEIRLVEPYLRELMIEVVKIVKEDKS